MAALPQFTLLGHTFNERQPVAEVAPSAPRNLRYSLTRRLMRRAFKAANKDRLTADWLSSGGDINQELRAQLHILRARARSQEQNSNMARRFLRLNEIHIVGPDGFNLQVKGKLKNGKLDTKGNKHTEADFKKWAKRGVCEISGRHSFKDVQRISVRTAARDGECLIRMHNVQPSQRNPWGFVIEMLDPARLDQRLNEDLKNGNRIRLGVELNGANRPVAYWLKRGERNGLFNFTEKHDRVEADDLIHWFDSERPEQLRAATWMCSAMLTMHHVNEYQEAAIVAARAGASKMGFYTAPDGNPHALGDDTDGDEDGADLLEDFEPGKLDLLPPGYGFTGFDPKYPHEAYGPFIKVNQHDAAMGLGVSYHALTGDLADVNFSSIRSGTQEERENWKVKQDSFSAGLMEIIYLRWLNMAVLNKRVGANLSQENALDRYGDHDWKGRRWQWVDPLKDIQAIILAINAGMTSPKRVASELGLDVEELLDEIAEFQQMLKEKNITLPVVPKASASAKEKEKKEKDNAEED